MSIVSIVQPCWRRHRFRALAARAAIACALALSWLIPAQAQVTRLPPPDEVEAPRAPLHRAYDARPASEPAKCDYPPNFNAQNRVMRATFLQAPEPIPVTGSRLQVLGRNAPRDEGRAEGDPIVGVSLAELSNFALSNSPKLREAAGERAAAEGRAIQAGLYPNPEVATASPQLGGSQSVGNIGQYNVFMSQDIVTKGKLKLDSAAAWRTARRAELDQVRAKYAVLTSTRQQFYIALSAQRRVEVLSDLVGIARQSKDVEARLLEGGEGTKSDLLLLDIELERAEMNLENARTLVVTNKRQLAATIGAPDRNLPPLVASLEAPLANFELVAVQEQAVSRNALAESAEVEMARSQIQLRRAQVEPFPNVNFMGGYQYEQQIPHQLGLYQVTMVVPLWNRNQGNIRAAEASVGAATSQYRRVQTELASDAAAAFGRFETARQRVERFEKQILPKARETQKITQNLYSEGQIDFLRLLASQRTLVEANLNYIDAQQDRWTAAAEVAGLLQLDEFP